VFPETKIHHSYWPWHLWPIAGFALSYECRELFRTSAKSPTKGAAILLGFGCDWVNVVAFAGLDCVTALLGATGQSDAKRCSD
jgi:hypothetical protein